MAFKSDKIRNIFSRSTRGPATGGRIDLRARLAGARAFTKQTSGSATAAKDRGLTSMGLSSSPSRKDASTPFLKIKAKNFYRNIKRYEPQYPDESVILGGQNTMIQIPYSKKIFDFNVTFNATDLSDMLRNGK